MSRPEVSYQEQLVRRTEISVNGEVTGIVTRPLGNPEEADERTINPEALQDLLGQAIARQEDEADKAHDEELHRSEAITVALAGLTGLSLYESFDHSLPKWLQIGLGAFALGGTVVTIGGVANTWHVFRGRTMENIYRQSQIVSLKRCQEANTPELNDVME